MKALCRPHWFWVEGFMQSQFVGCPLTMPSRFVVIGLLGLNYLSFHPGYGFVHATDGCAVGYIVFFSALFYLSIVSWLIGRTMRVIPCVFSVLLQDQMTPCSSVHSLSYLTLSARLLVVYPVCSPCGFRGSHLMLGVDSTLPVLVHRANP
jgi:hypothetical protein